LHDSGASSKTPGYTSKWKRKAAEAFGGCQAGHLERRSQDIKAPQQCKNSKQHFDSMEVNSELAGLFREQQMAALQ